MAVLRLDGPLDSGVPLQRTVHAWLGLSVSTFPGSEWIYSAFAVVFAYGGVLFHQMAVPEVRDRLKEMMTLISMAITVAFVSSLASVISPTHSAFFWGACDGDRHQAAGA